MSKRNSPQVLINADNRRLHALYHCGIGHADGRRLSRRKNLRISALDLCKSAFKKFLKNRLKGKIIILGMGNILRRDDGFGSHLVRELKGNVRAEAIDGESAPENCLGSIVKGKPDLILIVDAVDFSDKPGTIRLFAPSQIKTANLFATHNLSPQLLINFLQCQTEADILILAVQPKDVSFGKGLSKELKQSLKELKDALIKILGK